MEKLYFTRYFTKGCLKGLSHVDSIPFVSVDAAMAWIKGIKSNTKLDYTLTDYSFQNYKR